MIQTLLALLLVSPQAFAAPAAQDYKLGIVLVVDQFRADYLMRFREKFAAQGYRKLMEEGAYFPLADHGLLQNMTGPGHAAMLSGAYPYRHGISVNMWFDRETKKQEYCVQDDATHLIGSEGVIAGQGISPKNFNASTVGDELKNVDRASRVVSIAQKDRAAVLMGGRRTDSTLWIEPKACQWITSDFFAKQLPDFVKKANQRLSANRDQNYVNGKFSVKKCSLEGFRSPWPIDETFSLAEDAVDHYQLGKGKDTDLLLLSLSSPDYLGHQVGPNDPSMEAMTLAEDQAIAKFLDHIGKKLPHGLKDVFVVLTGDHGVPPTPKALPADRITTQNIPEDQLPKQIEKILTDELGKPSGGPWVEAFIEFQLYVNQKAVKDAKTSVSHIAELLRARLQKEPYLDGVWARDDIRIERKVPALDLGKIMDRTLSSRSGDILFLLKPYYFSDSYPLTHMTHYSYDRYVPLIFWGRGFKAGTYRQIVNVVDIAPTLSSVLHVLPPNQSEGRVITEILR